MQIELSEEDDAEVVEALMAATRQMRKRRDPRGAITAGKIEICLESALAEIRVNAPRHAAPQQD